MLGWLVLLPLAAGQQCGSGWVPTPLPPDTQPSPDPPDPPDPDPSIPTGDIAVTPTLRDFGVVVLGGFSVVQPFQVTNRGRANLNIGTVRITGRNAGSFTIVGETCALSTLVPLATCTVQVMCVPITPGYLEADLTVNSDDPDTPTLRVPLRALASQF